MGLVGVLVRSVVVLLLVGSIAHQSSCEGMGVPSSVPTVGERVISLRRRSNDNDDSYAKSDSLQQVSSEKDGEGVRRLDPEDRNMWEDTKDMGNSGGVTKGQKVEAAFAIVAAIVTALLTNYLTKAAVTHFS